MSDPVSNLEDAQHCLDEIQTQIRAIQRDFFGALTDRLRGRPEAEACIHHENKIRAESVKRELDSFVRKLAQCELDCEDEKWWQRDKAEVDHKPDECDI